MITKIKKDIMVSCHNKQDQKLTIVVAIPECSINSL